MRAERGRRRPEDRVAGSGEPSDRRKRRRVAGGLQRAARAVPSRRSHATTSRAPTAYELPRVVHPCRSPGLAGTGALRSAPTRRRARRIWRRLLRPGPAADRLRPQTALFRRRYGQGRDDRDRRLLRVADHRHDLATFDSAFHLPRPPSLSIVTQPGALPPWESGFRRTDAGLGRRNLPRRPIRHAMAPGARLVLVETPVAETEGTAGFLKSRQARSGLSSTSIRPSSARASGDRRHVSERILAPRAPGRFKLGGEGSRHGVGSTGDDGSTDFSSVSGTALFTSRRRLAATDPLVTAVAAAAALERQRQPPAPG